MSILDRLCGWCAARGLRRVVPDHIDPTRDYLIRHYLAGDMRRDKTGELRHDKWAVCLHKVLISDDDFLHDHPGAYVSLILRGKYIEHTPRGSFVRRAGHIRFRSGRSAHRLELPWGPVTTLFIFGPRYRNWGFYLPSNTPKGIRWVSHEEHGV